VANAILPELNNRLTKMLILLWTFH